MIETFGPVGGTGLEPVKPLTRQVSALPTELTAHIKTQTLLTKSST
jgi:hypothetical protein